VFIWPGIQIAVVFLVVGSNIVWHWTPNSYLPGLAGVFAAALLRGIYVRLWQLWNGFPVGAPRPFNENLRRPQYKETTKGAIVAADTAGTLMHFQMKTAAALVTRPDAEGPILAFAYGLLSTAVRSQGADCSIDLATRFVQKCMPEIPDPKQAAVGLIQMESDPNFGKFRAAGTAAFKRFHDSVARGDKVEWSLRSTDDLARALGFRW
jgi:hypothetical protein